MHKGNRHEKKESKSYETKEKVNKTESEYKKSLMSCKSGAGCNYKAKK